MIERHLKRYVGKIVELNWVDICSHSDFKESSIKYITKMNGLALSQDYGVVVRVEDGVLTLAHSITNINSFDLCCFPVEVIEKIRVLK